MGMPSSMNGTSAMSSEARVHPPMAIAARLLDGYSHQRRSQISLIPVGRLAALAVEVPEGVAAQRVPTWLSLRRFTSRLPRKIVRLRCVWRQCFGAPVTAASRAADEVGHQYAFLLNKQAYFKNTAVIVNSVRPCICHREGRGHCFARAIDLFIGCECKL